MTTLEIIVAILGSVGLADIIKTLVDKHFSKKQDTINNNRDEFAVLKDRVEFAEKEIAKYSRQQMANNRRISRLYTFLCDLTLLTCSKEKCPMRDIIAIDFDAIEGDIEDEYKQGIDEIKDDGK